MADEAIESFWEELDSGEIHIRDQWQFALKSEFSPEEVTKASQYTQEFYFFIPSSLLINSNTYTKSSFYLDETNLIRYKTPEFSFEQLLDAHHALSPLARILFLCQQEDNEQHRESLSDELKLFANVVRSTLRREVRRLVWMLSKREETFLSQDFTHLVLRLCSHLQQLRERFSHAEKQCLDNWHDPLFYRQMLYIDEFMSYSISHYLTGLLESIRLAGRSDLSEGDQALCEILLQEKQLSDLLIKSGGLSTDVYYPLVENSPFDSTKQNQIEDSDSEGRGASLRGKKEEKDRSDVTAKQNEASQLEKGIDAETKESVLYRYGLLNKFVLEALQLTTNRFSLDQQYQHWIAAVSAGIAMMIYFSLFIWLGNVFVINSAPFVILTVVCYVLKDRIKEWLRIVSYLHATRWFPDYTTEIKTQGGKAKVGIMKESFSFIESSQLPQEIKTIRNAEFHSVLETVQRPENIIFYKRVFDIQALPKHVRRHGINVVFRFNIQQFLRKASNPSETHLVIDSETHKLVSIPFPKVYHLNLIMRSTKMEPGKAPISELKKLRIIIDKKGIKRIEQVSKK